MRIIGYLPHDSFKITVFKDNNRLSVKLESGLYEQTYKFRDRPTLQTLEQVQALVDADFIAFVTKQFREMHRAKTAALGRALPPDGEWLDTIL